MKRPGFRSAGDDEEPGSDCAAATAGPVQISNETRARRMKCSRVRMAHRHFPFLVKEPNAADRQMCRATSHRVTTCGRANDANRARTPGASGLLFRIACG